MLAILLIATVVAAIPLIAFRRLPTSRRQGAYQLLPWVSGIGLFAIAVFVLLVNVGILSP